MKKELSRIVQSNDLVRAFPSLDNEMRLSLVQKRVLFYLISKLREEEKHPIDKNWVRVDVGTMVKEVLPTSKGGKNTVEVWNALDEFRDKRYDLLIRYEDDKGNLRERATSWILEVDRPVVGSGYLDVHIPNLIVKHVREQSSLFTMLDMPTARKLKSYSQMKLWELLTSFSSLGRWEVSIKELRRLLEIKDESYQRPSDFRKHVITKSIEAINRETRLSVKFFMMKDGKDTVGVLFHIGQKKKEKADTPPVYPPELENELKKKGIQHLNKYHKEGITDKHWVHALEQNLSEGQLVAEARKTMDKERAEQNAQDSKLSQAERMDKNRAWWEAHKDEFPEDSWEDEKTVFVKGKGYNYASESFVVDLERFKT